MLSGIYNAVSRLVAPGNNQFRDDNDDEPTSLALPSSNQTWKDANKSSYSYPSSYSYQENTNASPSTLDSSNIKTVQGTITRIDGSGYGLIDDDIVFTYDVVERNERPRVGTRVQVEAYWEGGWKAKKVSLSLDWNVDDPSVDDPIEIQTIVGTVTKVELKTGRGYINQNIAFDQDALAHGFKPCRGDWIEAELHTDPETQQDFAKNVRPLRHRQFDGVVTCVYPGYGYIDNKIYFMFSNCKGYRPEKGDLVRGKAIESDQSKGRWRATEVEKKAIYKRQHRATESPLQSQRMQELEQNKRGIIISTNLQFGSIVIDETKSIQVSIRNVGSINHTLKSSEACSLSASVSIKVYNRSYATPEAGIPMDKPFILPASVPSSSSMVAVLSVTARELGRTSFQVIFDFGSFQIGRTVTMTVEDPQTLPLGPTSAATPRGGKLNRRDRLKDIYSESRSNDGCIVPGRRVVRNFDINVPVKLPSYVVPRDLEQAVLQDEDVTLSYPELNQGLNMDNFSIRFSALLHLEEIHMQIDMRQFDLEKVSMKPRLGEYLSLEVPGLAEGRPSVMIGDKIILSSPNANKYSPKYEGIVHEVLSDVVLLKFNEKFQESYQAEEYNVAFTFSRTPLRRCHQAADFAKNLGMQVLFPSRVEAKPPQVNITYQSQTTVTTMCRPRIPTNLPRLTSPKPNQHQSTTPRRPINSKPYSANAFSTPKAETEFVIPKIDSPTNVKHAKTTDGTLVANFFNSKLNVRQKAAVVRVLQGEGRPTPYIIFGPPGTGKTVTVVEAILQVHQHMPSSRILACTPSNSAADLLTERLHLSGHVKNHELIRLNSFRRNEDSIPDIIRQYCRDGEELDKIAHYRMLVCTCTTSGSFYQLGLKAGHFTHVFVDEAGQATEPECLIPAGLAFGSEGQIILAGDPMQLGPVLSSDIAKDYGLDLSLLERLSKRPLYRRDVKKFRDHGNYDPLLVTKLVENYRSHPALLQLSSNIFYHGELEPQAESDLISSLCDWEMLPNKVNCPLIFHGIRGEDLREGNSPSWFNPMEVVQVAKYLKSLLALEKPKIKTSDIGIITPYRKQVEKIRLILTTLEVHGVKVGSVEEFQGQERLVMIISTVRSTENLVDFDVRHHLGFVSNPKRFNVSITRAQALQIIVGNPYVLAKDRYWRALLRFCVDKEAYIGCDLPELGDEIIEEGDMDIGIEDVMEEEEEVLDADINENTNTANGFDEEELLASPSTPSQPNKTYGELVTSLNNSQPDDERLDNHDSPQRRSMNKQSVESKVPQDTQQEVLTQDSLYDGGAGDSGRSYNSCSKSSSGEYVQSNTKHAKEHTPINNSTKQQPHCIQDAGSYDVLKMPTPESANIHSIESEGVDNSIYHADAEESQDINRNVRRMKLTEEQVIVANSVQGEASSPCYTNDQPLTSTCPNALETFQKNDVKSVRPKCEPSELDMHAGGHHSQGETKSREFQTLSSNSKVEMKACAIKSVVRQDSAASSYPVLNTRDNVKKDKKISNHKEQVSVRMSSSHLNQPNEMSEHQQLPRKKKSPTQVQTDDPRSVVPIARRAHIPSQTETVDSLYQSTSDSCYTPPNKGQCHIPHDKGNTGNNSNNIIPAGARCQSPVASEASSEPSVHLSDDSGPEEFQDYTPSRSASDISIDEKSQHSRGWWTKGQVAKRPQPSHRRRPNSSKHMSAGRGGYYRPPRQRQEDNNLKDYYVGLGRGRGRPMQMAAQMQEGAGSNRPFSFGRGNFQRK